MKFSMVDPPIKLLLRLVGLFLDLLIHEKFPV